MEQKKQLQTELPTKCSVAGVAFGSVALGVGLGVGIYYLIQKNKCKDSQPVNNESGTKYVLVTMSGSPMTFTEAQVLEIKRLYEDGTSPTAIAERYGINVIMVSRVVHGIKI